jgi:NAD+ synthase
MSAEMTADLDAKLKIDTHLARRTLVAFIRDAVTKAGFERAVVGLSGGIDSAVTCYLTAEALGPENVLALLMPYATSSPSSMTDAQLVIDRLGVRSATVPITEMVDPLLERFPDMDDNRRGNVMARMRMIVLYDQSAAFDALVVGAGNKTEILLGYTTLHGDSAAAMHPLGDLYKTQVRQLARALSLPQSILEKPPSADLWPGQTDEGELGYTYTEVDRLLYLLIDERHSLEEAVEAGFGHEFVQSVWTRVQRNQFKRVPPRVCKISRRAPGHNSLHPRDGGH